MTISVFGFWIKIHREIQWCYKGGQDYKPWVCVHIGRTVEWSKRLFCI
jgi:hypothetical protein